MRIGISCYPTFGGSGVVASELGMGLAERGHDVHFITYAVPGRLNVYRPGIYYHEVTVPDYPLFEYPPYSLALASKMSEIALREGLQVIHAHYAIPHAASALIAREIVGDRRLSVVTTLHGTDITLVGRDPSFLPVTRYSIEKSDAVTAVSAFLKDEICRTFTCEKEISVIHNFVDPRDFDNLETTDLRQRFAPAGEKLLVHVSNFRKVKRIQDVIGIFLGVREQIPTKLVLVGTGPELSQAENLARQGGADHDLVVLGNRERVLDIIAACDLFLLPSESESFGLAALEAMACGVPPIATNTGGVPEVIENGVTGFLLPVGDVSGMTQRAMELLLDEAARQRMGMNARSAAFGRFNLNRALDAYEEVYRRVCKSCGN